MRLFVSLLSFAAVAAIVGHAQSPRASDPFKTSDQCMACHNNLRTPAGEDVSIGTSWRTSMMANSSRDPYWQAAVRRELLDHASVADDIQDECATCHMPMSRTEAQMSGNTGRIFEHLPVRHDARGRQNRLAHDGVSCSLCHQITDRNFGTLPSFTGGYVVSVPEHPQPRPIFGPFQIERGISTIMRSATGFQPTEALHVKQSELCATCHTLVTKARGPGGEVVGELPEQMAFLEWKNSAFVGERRSCQSCHMPEVEQETPISSVLGAPRKAMARHAFIGGNFFIQEMLNRYRDQLGVSAPAAQMNAAVGATLANLESRTATVAIELATVSNGQLVADITVHNLTGHKLPTGYPSRRVWLHVTVRDRSGQPLFESGGLQADGSIRGGDNDANASQVDLHYNEITKPEDVQVYESVMGDSAGRPTTGLLSGIGYLKDNRLLPRGFDKAAAHPWTAVVGAAREDVNFSGGKDHIRYRVDVSRSNGPFRIEVELRFQVIGFRWADNLRAYNAEEATRFVRYYDSMASSSSALLASAVGTVR